MQLTPNSLPKIDYAEHPAYGGMFEPDPALAEGAMSILRPLIDEMTRIEAERVEKFGYRYGQASPEDAELVDNSMTRRQVSAPHMARIEAAAKPYLDALRERLAGPRATGQKISFKMINTVLSEEADSDLWRAVDDAMRDGGAYDTVRAFFSADTAKLNSLAVFFNPAEQSWIGPPFRDIDQTIPPTVGMHIDSNGKSYLKAILYLNDVGPEQGPTCVVPGSHRWEQGSVERIWRRAYDRSKLLSRSEAARQTFISLPKSLQVKAEFGGDMLPDAPETKALLEQEFVSTGPRGSYTLFNPEAAHRGGWVTSGERHALQITLGARW